MFSEEAYWLARNDNFLRSFSEVVPTPMAKLPQDLLPVKIKSQCPLAEKQVYREGSQAMQENQEVYLSIDDTDLSAPTPQCPEGVLFGTQMIMQESSGSKPQMICLSNGPSLAHRGKVSSVHSPAPEPWPGMLAGSPDNSRSRSSENHPSCNTTMGLSWQEM